MSSPITPSTHVPTERVRTAALQQGLTFAQIARAMGYERRMPDVERVKQDLGIKNSSSGGGRPRARRRHMTTAKAAQYARALDIDLHDLDL